MSILWKSIGAGSDPLHGHCGAGEDEWCAVELKRPEQITVVNDPVPPLGKAFRFEVQFGDKDPRYSEDRALLDPPYPGAYANEGDERWYRYQSMWPSNWVGWFPKGDELSAWPRTGTNGGSSAEWHSAPQDLNNWNVNYGYPPIYSGAQDNDLWFVLTNTDTFEHRRESAIDNYLAWNSDRACYILAPLVRGKWHDWVWHMVWGSTAATGRLAIWIDGVNVLPTVSIPMQNWRSRIYFLAGLYRIRWVGDPGLRWPRDAVSGVSYPSYPSRPQSGALVYPTGDLSPQQVYHGGFVIGTTQDDVGSVANVPPKPPPPPGTPPGSPPGTQPPPSQVAIGDATSAPWRRTGQALPRIRRWRPI